MVSHSDIPQKPVKTAEKQQNSSAENSAKEEAVVAANPSAASNLLVSQANAQSPQNSENIHNTVDLSALLAAKEGDGNVEVAINHNVPELHFPMLEELDIELEQENGQTLLKGSVASLKMVLGVVDVVSPQNTGSQALKLKVNIQSEFFTPTEHKVVLFFDDSSGRLVPRFKVGDNVLFEEGLLSSDGSDVGAYLNSTSALQNSTQLANGNSLLQTTTTAVETVNQTLLEDSDDGLSDAISDAFSNIEEIVEAIAQESVVEEVVEEEEEEVVSTPSPPAPPANNAPALDSAQADQFLNDADVFSLDVSGNFSDADADALTYTAELSGGGALPAWLSFNGATGVFSGTPAQVDRGVITVDVTADDGKGGTVTDTFDIDVNARPVDNSLGATLEDAADIGSAYTYSGAMAVIIEGGLLTDADGDDMTFTAQQVGGGALPAWLSINAADGVLSGTPGGGDTGIYEIEITADDGNGGTATATFMLYVDDFTYFGDSNPVNQAGGAGSDVMWGGYGLAGDDDTLDGGNGDDSIYGGVNDDEIYGGEGADSIYAGGGDDTIDAGHRNDTVYAGDGDDSVDGGEWQDYIEGGAGEDTLGGGNGNDTIYGGEDNDTVTGGAGHDQLYGDEGDDNISATGGNNTMYGGDGNDILDNSVGGVGGRLYGEDGDDSIYGGSSQQSIVGGAGDDLIDSGNQHDTLHGGDGNDTIYAGSHNDYLYGEDGDDVLYSEAGNDSLWGGDGNDILVATTGNNRVVGGTGNDTITGGAGNDWFLFGEFGVANADNLTDFGTEVWDLIRLDDAVFTFATGDGAKNGVALTDNTDIFDVGVDFTGGSFAAGGGATFLYDDTDGQVWYDADGDGGVGTAELVFTIDNFATYVYQASDFYGHT